MKIEDLQETAALAHLTLDDQELRAAFPAFEQMIGFFAAMQAADEDKAVFAAHLSGTSLTVSSNHFRQDNPDNTIYNFTDNPSHSLNQETLVSTLLNNAGERDGKFVVVPNVL
jgi:aspartyl-tRNA(Asn)/glutamyl-tRNA(Gln) amidotransferase subunit C